MNTLHQLWLLDGRGPYVWGALLACALAFALELWGLQRRRQALGPGPDAEDVP